MFADVSIFSLVTVQYYRCCCFCCGCPFGHDLLRATSSCISIRFTIMVVCILLDHLDMFCSGYCNKRTPGPALRVQAANGTWLMPVALSMK